MSWIPAEVPTQYTSSNPTFSSRPSLYQYGYSRGEAVGQMKKKRINQTAIVEGTQNVYADLGHADSEGMLIKAQLVSAIAHILRARSLTQSRAADLLGLTQPKISAMLKGQFRGISERRLLDCLTRLGRDVQIVVKPAPRSRANGKLTLSVTSDRVAAVR